MVSESAILIILKWRASSKQASKKRTRKATRTSKRSSKSPRRKLFSSNKNHSFKRHRPPRRIRHPRLLTRIKIKFMK